MTVGASVAVVAFGLLVYRAAVAFQSASTSSDDLSQGLRRLWWLYAMQVGLGLAGICMQLWVF